jgi:hypothetical protein
MSRTLLTLLILAGLTAFATDWSAVAALGAGSRVKVQPAKGKQISGRVSRATADTICVSRRAGEACFDKTDVHRVRVRAGKARARNAAIVGGVTAGIWTAFVVIAWGRSSDADDVPHLLYYGIPLLGGVGAGIAALFPGYTTTYESP